ncbi:hypothetical protein niasHS_004408 [Heterodera schachtii]|uniref:Uncharacterized protein n=1 Tax=Heterodera schachtii TaxID=97005 RepID=A0ABD2JL12_HETSC
MPTPAAKHLPSPKTNWKYRITTATTAATNHLSVRLMASSLIRPAVSTFTVALVQLLIEMSRICFYLDKALKVFHRRFPAMAAKAVKEAALFGDEMGNKRVRNVAATILYTMPLKREEEEEANDEGEEGGKERHGTAEETEEDEQKQQMLKNEEEEEVDQNLCPPNS